MIYFILFLIEGMNKRKEREMKGVYKQSKGKKKNKSLATTNKIKIKYKKRKRRFSNIGQAWCCVVLYY